jgi:hypothetical protein
MAINKEELEIGKKYYMLQTNNNMTKRRKIFMTDSEGNEWTRYDRALWTYTAQEITLVGIVKYVTRGQLDPASEHRNEYHFKDIYGSIDYIYEEDLFEDNVGPFGTNYYTNKEVAIAVGEEICKQANAE